MEMAIYAYTSCSFSYLNRARVLAQTLRRVHPEWKLWLVMTDKEPPGFQFDLSGAGYDGMLTAEELFSKTADSWLFKHDIVEACTAVKGRALRHLLSRKDCSKVIYFDPDIAAFNPLSEVVDALDRYSIVLTPHQVEPEPRENLSAIRDNEIASLLYGTFNLGFLAVSNDHEANRFAEWWQARLDDLCYDEPSTGVFVDQSWCNLIPCFFDNVKILRHPGYNVASWNLSHRLLSFDDSGSALVNGLPLRFFHFTKLGSVGDVMTERYARDNIEVYELWWWYKQAVESNTLPGIPAGWWQYGQFDNGDRVPKNARELYRKRLDLETAFPRPFRTGPGSFHSWLKDNTDLLSGGGSFHGFHPA